MIKKWAKDLNRHLHKEDTQMISKHMKLRSTSYVTGELKIKTTIRYHGTPIRMVRIQNTDHIKCCGHCGASGTLIHCWWDAQWFNPIWETVWQFLTKQHILSFDPAIALLGIFSRSWNFCQQKTLHNDVYSSFIRSCKNLKVNQDVLQLVNG